MSRYHILTAITVASSALLLSSSSAHAQLGQPGQGGPRPTSSVSEPDGVAEQAPKKLGVLPTTPVLPPPKESSKQLRVFGLDGYFRFRSSWMKQLDLGFRDINTDSSLGGAPFTNRLGCRSDAFSSEACKGSAGSANVRLRLEPIVHLDERSSVHMQIDILDNLVLGSTSNGYSANGNGDLPLGAFGEGQRSPQAGINSTGNSIVVKRAWAEIDAPFGLLKFGRQPWHWGMGMVANAGGKDPIHGGYNLDSNGGDTVDRVSFSAQVPGTDFNASIAADWGQTGPTSSQAGEEVGLDRQSWDLDDSDDADQWLFMISRMDSPTKIADMLADGDAIINFGAFLAYRTQGFEQRGLQLGQSPNPDNYVKRNLAAYVPNVWAHFAKGNFDAEMEAVAVIGSLDSLTADQERITLRQFGGVARLKYKLLDGDLIASFEGGFASGDKYRNKIPGQLDVSGAVGVGQNDSVLKQFMFDRNYQVDLILFRELIGAVTNAFYAKPTFQYNITSKFAGRASGILSAAHNKLGTTGLSNLLGVEFDADLGYTNNGFFAGISYGILLPFAGLDHALDQAQTFGPSFQKAQTAQTIQTRMVLQF